MTYGVLGYAGDPEPTILYECDDLIDAIRWAQNYIRRGDWGGYDEIHVKNEEGTSQVQFVREEE